jgi:hypothetical protein
MSTEPPDGRDETDAGWAAPELPPTEPASDPATPEQATPESTLSAAPPPGAAPTPPPPPAPPAAPTAPAAPPTKRRKTWLVALLAVVGVGIVVAIAGTVLFVDRTLPPFDAANEFLDDLADSDVDRAAAQLCSSDREDAEDAIGEVTSKFPGGDELYVNLLGVDREGDRAWVEFTIKVGDDDDADNDRSYRLPIRQEDGEWRPCPGDGVQAS